MNGGERRPQAEFSGVAACSASITGSNPFERRMIVMKRFITAALAAATVLAGGAAAQAAPFHGGGGHGPVVAHGGPAGFHPAPGPVGGFHPTPIGFHPGPGPVGGFHGVGGWRGPHAGFGYHGWGFGAFVPRALLGPEYFIFDFADYGLAPPPANFEWVQDGPNALLVNVYTGQVVQVVPNSFVG
jgi:Ni/Co efflux regulator RcnB